MTIHPQIAAHMKAFTVCLLLLLSAQLAVGQYLTTDSADPIEINTTDSHYAILLPIKPATGIDFKQIILPAHPKSVRIEKTMDKSLTDAIALSKDTTESGIVLTLSMANFSRQGAYEVHIGYQYPGKDPGELSIKLFRPAATLDTVSTVTIDYTSGDIQRKLLVLREMGNKVAINGLKLNTPVFDRIGSDRLLYFDDTAITVPAGGWKKFDYKFDVPNVEKLDFGHYYGKMYLYSGQLTGPVAVTFDFWRRRQRWTIVLCILIGLLIGAFVRHYLKDNKEYEQVRYKGYQVLSDMIAQLKKIADPVFKAAVQPLVEQLESDLRKPVGGISGSTAATLQTAVDHAATAYANARSALQSAISDQQKNYTELASTFESPALPPVFREYFVSAIGSFQDFKNFLAVSDPTDAAKKLPILLQDTQRDFDQYTTYLKDVTGFLAGGQYYLAATTSALKESIAAAIQPMQTVIPATPIKIGSPSELTDLFKKIAGLESGFINLVTQLDQNYHFLYKQTHPGGPDAAFTQAYNAYTTALAALVTNNPPLITTSSRWDQQLVTNVDNAWNAAIARGAIAFIDKKRADVPGISDQLAPDVETHTATDIAVIEASPINVEDMLKSTSRRYYFFALLQTASLMILLGFAGYNFYGPNSTGTPGEIITIFWLSFSTDLTLDNVLTWKDKKL